MSQITVRQADLADAASITAIHNAAVETWTRRDFDGDVIPADYDELSLFERWCVGGVWASVEMGAVHLANLLRGSDRIPLVATINGVIRAEAEIAISHEPEPFGHHVNLSRLAVHPDDVSVGLGTALLTYIHQIGEAIRARRITAADGGPNADLFEHHGFRRVHSGQRLIIPAEEGRVFYKASELTTFDPGQITGWHMPLGRYQNAREEWDRMQPGLWNCVPLLVEPEKARLHITLTGQEVFAFMEQDRDDPAQVHAFVWSRRPLNALVIMALRDWAAQHDYKTIAAFAWDYVIPILEIDTQSDGYTQHLYAAEL
ncbi:MAG: GNAT family N-acetyltransferase [Anaerolineae bacterium]|nr:GNAT family N-acetyltransferase [Anaerolineae bacterium]